jgi:hypothetical protein
MEVGGGAIESGAKIVGQDEMIEEGMNGGMEREREREASRNWRNWMVECEWRTGVIESLREGVESLRVEMSRVLKRFARDKFEGRKVREILDSRTLELYDRKNRRHTCFIIIFGLLEVETSQETVFDFRRW